MKKLELDVHTHTLASGHAYGTIAEMAQAASEKGLKLLGISDHAKGIPGTCDDMYFINLGVVPRQQYGVELMLGAEINIIDYNGKLSLDNNIINRLDIRIAGIHKYCYTYGTMEQNTNAIVEAIRNPRIDIISHPDDGNCPLDYERIVQEAKKHHTLLEINNNSLRSKSRKCVFENSLEILRLCKQYDVPVIMNSDAHHMVDIANMDHVEKVLQEIDFPEDLILNYSVEKFKAYIQYNREYQKKALG